VSSDNDDQGIEPGDERNKVEMVANRPTPDSVDEIEAKPGDTFARGQSRIGHGSVLIAAITSCTNTSNPSVMLAAGLLAKKAVERGLTIDPAVKTSLAPGSLVVAFALAGSVDLNLSTDPIGKGSDGREVFLRDLWPSLQEIRDTMQSALTPEVFQRLYRDFAGQNPKWNDIPSSAGEIYEWDEKSDYIHQPPFFENFSMSPGKIEEIRGARPLGIFGDSVTTDHISPAGAIKATS